MSLSGFTLIGKHTLPTMSDSHSDFVAYLKYADFASGVLDLLDDGGGDIRFSSDEAGNNQLPCEVVEFDKTGSSIQIWVKIPTATTGTIIYIWGDNTGASQPVVTDPYGRNAVWSDYWAAYHFTDLTDSSGNSNDLTVVGTPTNTTVEIIGEAYDFADSGDYLYTDSVFVAEDENFLMSFYYKVEDINNLPLGGYVYGIADSTDAYDNYSIVLTRGGTTLYIQLFDRTTSTSPQQIFAFAPSNGDLFKIIAQQSSTGTDLTVIHNGVVSNDATSNRHLQGSGFNRLSINRLMDNSPATGDGIWADEPRVGKHNVIRSQAFLLDEYNNQTAATSWGTMELYSAPSNPNSTIAFGILSPSFSVDSSSTIPALTSDVAFNINTPTFAVDATNNDPQSTSDIAFSITSPSFSIDASNVDPSFASDIAFDILTPTFAIDSSTTKPGANSTIAFGINSPSFAVDSTASDPQFASDVAFGIGSPTFAISSTSTINRSSSIAFDIGTPSFSVSATNTDPAFNTDVAFGIGSPSFSVVSEASYSASSDVAFEIASPSFSVSSETTIPDRAASVSFNINLPQFLVVGVTGDLRELLSDRGIVVYNAPSGIVKFRCSSGIIKLKL